MHRFRRDARAIRREHAERVKQQEEEQQRKAGPRQEALKPSSNCIVDMFQSMETLETQGVLEAFDARKRSCGAKKRRAALRARLRLLGSWQPRYESLTTEADGSESL